MLVHQAAGEHVWREDEDRLARRELSLREVLIRQAAYVRLSLDEADAYLQAHVRFDPSFADFVARCSAAAIPVTVVSSGAAPIIRRALARHGLGDLPLVANEIDARPTGWSIDFIDAGENGTDKVRRVREVQAGGHVAVYIGDGVSDFDAALAADLRFAKRGRALERYLASKAIPYVSFSSFSQIEVSALRSAPAQPG